MTIGREATILVRSTSSAQLLLLKLRCILMILDKKLRIFFVSVNADLDKKLNKRMLLDSAIGFVIKSNRIDVSVLAIRIIGLLSTACRVL